MSSLKSSGAKMKQKILVVYTIILAFIFSLFACDKDNGVNNESEPEIQPGDFYIDIYNSEKACNSTTLFADLHDTKNPRIIVINMQGEIVC